MYVSEQGLEQSPSKFENQILCCLSNDTEAALLMSLFSFQNFKNIHYKKGCKIYMCI